MNALPPTLAALLGFGVPELVVIMVVLAVLVAPIVVVIAIIVRRPKKDD